MVNKTGLNWTSGHPADFDEVIERSADVLGVWVTGVLCILGVAGNCLSFVVLQRAFGSSPMFFVLRGLCVSDTAFLASVFVVQTLVNAHALPVSGLNLSVYRSRVQYLVWPMLMATQMSTVWLTVLVSGERFVAICYPLLSQVFCTMSNARTAVALVTVASLLFNVPRYFEFSMDMAKTSIGSDPIYRYLYSCVLYCLLLFVVPLLILLYLNVRLVLALRAGRRRWLHLQVRQRREQTLTNIPLAIVAIFFICGTPSLAVNVADSINPDAFGNYNNGIYVVIANLLVVLNSASNFVVYLFVGKRFRSQLTELMTGSCSRCCCCGCSTGCQRNPELRPYQGQLHLNHTKRYSSTNL